MKSFYVPRSAPDSYSVNALCLDPGTVTAMRVIALDGANWSLEDRGPTPLRHPGEES